MKIPKLILFSLLSQSNVWCCQQPSKPTPESTSYASNSTYDEDEVEKRNSFITRLRARLPQDVRNLDQLQPQTTPPQSNASSHQPPEK